MLARSLAARGHEVTWWIATFEHRSKSFRQSVEHDPALPKAVNIKCLPTRGYNRHIGLGRIAFERDFGREFKNSARGMQSPDLIVLAEPSLFFGVPVRRFAQMAEVPIVLDIIDLWPELFNVVLPRILRPVGKLVFAPLYWRRRKLARQARGIAAVAGNYRDILLSQAGNKPSSVFYWGVDNKLYTDRGDQDRPELFDRWPFEFDGLTVIYAGTLGAAYDVQTVCETARKLLNDTNKRVRFIFAGDGPLKHEVIKLAAQHPDRCAYIGSVPAKKLIPYYLAADLGLCSYARGSTVSMPIKLFDYLAAGLAVANSLNGEIKSIIESGCGIQYNAEDPEDLANKLRELAHDPTTLLKYKARASELSKQFDITLQYRAFAQFVENMVDKNTE